MHRHRLTAIASTLAIAVAGCGVVPRTGQRLDVGTVRAAIAQRAAIDLHHEPPPIGTPGLPQLAGTYAGANRTERIVLLDFYSPEATAAALGREGARDRDLVLRRENLVVLYEHEPGGPDHREDLRAALDSAGYRD
jgi:hypothetical protein